MSDYDLTDRQKELVSYLTSGGASADSLAGRMNLTQSGVKSLIGRTRDSGVTIRYDREAQVYHLVDEPEARRLSTKAKGTITREANEFRSQQEDAVLRRLRGKEPLVAQQKTEPSNEDMVVALGDVHIGDVVEDERGQEVYNPRIAAASVQHVTQKALNLKRFQEALVDFDNCHLVWVGDMLTGEGIYDGQAYDTKLQLADQLSLTIEVLMQQAESFAREFDTLHITAVPGNHGKIRSSYTSGQANMDLVAYRWVADRLLDRGHENINFNVGEARHYRNHPLRDGEWNLHVRHGHDEQIHVDATARSQADARGMVHKHGLDGIVRGHHHTHREEDILNEYPCITVPSPKPGSEFAERIGRPDCSTKRKLGVTWRVSDERFKTGEYVVDDIDLDMDELDTPTIEEIRSRAI
ncbi:DNA polymerase II small subunit [Haloarcula californiae tailed virus 1]|uniref:DNA polymerase II small subunit n=1 Tax=Haloarcula californiae tailed virus 1 TaxID=1273746 RepID=R4TMG7_9CAUD|nr:exonuclease [Haloarcula californiae tailed virus 1]AGM11897.1 DNA polymerase II small subunit [Haloarcula californiae tailed virus 1]